MSEKEMLGYAVTIVITLGSFIGVVYKIMQPINDLKLVIQRLNDTINHLLKDNDLQNKRLENHGREIDDLKLEVNNLKTKVHIYHNTKEKE